MIRHRDVAVIGGGREGTPEEALQSALKRYTDLASVARARGLGDRFPGEHPTFGALTRVADHLRRRWSSSDGERDRDQLDRLCQKARRVEHDIHRDLQEIARSENPTEARSKVQARTAVVECRNAHLAITDLKNRIDAALETFSRADRLPTDTERVKSAMHDAATAFGTPHKPTMDKAIAILQGHSEESDRARRITKIISPGFSHTGRGMNGEELERDLETVAKEFERVQVKTKEWLNHAAESEIVATVRIARAIDDGTDQLDLSGLPAVTDALQGLNQIIMRSEQALDNHTRLNPGELYERRTLDQIVDWDKATLSECAKHAA